MVLKYISCLSHLKTVGEANWNLYRKWVIKIKKLLSAGYKKAVVIKPAASARRETVITVLEPMTGMDMPFSSQLAVGASVLRVPSNTGGFGGVMLHDNQTYKSIYQTKYFRKRNSISFNCPVAVAVMNETYLWRLRASLIEFFTTRQLLLAGRGEEASGSSMLGSLWGENNIHQITTDTRPEVTFLPTDLTARLTLIRGHKTIEMCRLQGKGNWRNRKTSWGHAPTLHWDITCVLEVSMVGIGLAFDPETGV